MPGRRAAVYARVQCREPKTGQQKVQLSWKTKHVAHLGILFIYGDTYDEEYVEGGDEEGEDPSQPNHNHGPTTSHPDTAGKYSRIGGHLCEFLEDNTF